MSAGGERREDSEHSTTPASNEISGTVSGPAVQARSIHGDVQINVGAHPRTPPPAQLAPAPALFIDREDELAQLDRLLREGQRQAPDSPTLVVVTGLGGVGKSSLALKWLHRVRHLYGDGQLYADLRGSEPGVPVSPGEILERFLRSLGIAPEYVPSSPDEQVTMFRSATAGRRLILMLDDPVSAAQVRAVLPASGHSLVLVTTRHRLSGLVVEGARFVDLDPLSPAAAVSLLDRMVGADRIGAEPVAALRLVTLCGRLPIAVCASAARLALRPRWPIERLVRELGDATRRLSMLSTDEDMSLQAAFDVSYGSLDDEVARLYRVLGLHPGTTFGSAVAAAAGDIGQGEAFRILDELAGANLVEVEDEDRFRFHDLLRLHAHAKALATESAEERRAAFTRIARWYLNAAVTADRVVIPGRWHLGPSYELAGDAEVVFEGPATALDWLEAELPNIRAVLAAAHEQEMHEITWEMCEALWGLFVNRKHYVAWVETYEMGLASARASRDPRAEPRMLLALATAHLNLQKFERAAEMCLRAVDLERSVGHALGEAAALSSLGVAYLGMREPQRSIEQFEGARTIHENLGRRRGVALMTRRIGEAYRDMGRYAAAVAQLNEAYELFRGLSDSYNEARVLTGLGQTHLLAERPEDAVDSLTRALEITETIGALFEQANIRLSLAEALAGTGDRVGARDHVVRALAIFTELGAPQAERARRHLDSLASNTPPVP
ncbi:tetratricopeptide repeat protein [Sphaerisporangium sp. NPDC049002]|uniref:tetratricopeptide repeat protein n=1 Tax=unclassified Sphaerisporangium TaxID=2630420 RepID=UPI0033DF7CD1